MQQMSNLDSLTNIIATLKAAMEHVPPQTKLILESVAQVHVDTVKAALEELDKLKAEKPATNKEK